MNLALELEGAPRGSVGEILHDAVVREGAAGANRKQAFERVAENSGRSVGAVSEAYYRVSRRRGGPSRSGAGATRKGRGRGRRKVASSGPARGAPRPSGGQEPIEAALARLVEAVEALGGVARAQEAELQALRGQAELLKELRQLVGTTLG